MTGIECHEAVFLRHKVAQGCHRDSLEYLKMIGDVFVVIAQGNGMISLKENKVFFRNDFTDARKVHQVVPVGSHKPFLSE